MTRVDLFSVVDSRNDSESLTVKGPNESKLRFRGKADVWKFRSTLLISQNMFTRVRWLDPAGSIEESGTPKTFRPSDVCRLTPPVRSPTSEERTELPLTVVKVRKGTP